MPPDAEPPVPMPPPLPPELVGSALEPPEPHPTNAAQQRNDAAEAENRQQSGLFFITISFASP
jgi:hypothetical protein